MKISPLFSSSRSFRPQKLALGVFDGFHLGHQALCQQASSLLSLYPHPKSVLGLPHSGYLSLKQERGLFFPHCYILHFDKAVASLPAQNFLEALHQQLSFSGLVVGYDFCCGVRRTGTIPFIEEWCKKRALTFDKVPCFKYKGVAVKSETIRQSLKAGNFNLAREYLGHDYVLSGKVIKGEGRGRKLGFPTANLQIDPEKCLPHTGVYKAYLNLNGQHKLAIVYVGFKPTFKGNQHGVEVHIPDFNQDLYHQHLTVFLTKEIRKDKRFEQKEALIEQINKDIITLYHD